MSEIATCYCGACSCQDGQWYDQAGYKLDDGHVCEDCFCELRAGGERGPAHEELLVERDELRNELSISNDGRDECMGQLSGVKEKLAAAEAERDRLHSLLHDFHATDATIAIQEREEARDQLRAALADLTACRDQRDEYRGNLDNLEVKAAGLEAERDRYKCAAEKLSERLESQPSFYRNGKPAYWERSYWLEDAIGACDAEAEGEAHDATA